MIAGIDLSLTSTGCIYLKNKKIKNQLLIKTKATDKNPLKELERLYKIINSIDIVGLKLAVIEGIAYGISRTISLSQLSGLNYLIRDRLYYHNVPFVIVPPPTLKKFITGKGNCKKDLMLLETYKKYKISFSNDNLCDAYGLAKIGEALTEKNNKLTKSQQEVINILKKQLT